MKQKFLQISILLLMFSAYQSTAQVTITENDYPRLAEFVDSGYVVNDVGVPIPTIGPDQVWDYSTIDLGVFATKSYFDATNDPDFTNALNYTEDNFRVNIGGFEFDVPSNTYEEIDEDGWFKTGRSVENTVIPLTPLTQNPDDKIEYLGGKLDYVGRGNFLQFPLNYQDQWDLEYHYDLLYEVTAVDYGLNQTPAFTRTLIDNTREVVGYGSVIIPRVDGTPSEPIEVLLIEGFVTEIDSIYLGGNPAPQALLDAFGLTQGFTRQDSFYIMYAPGFASPVMIFETIDNGMANNTDYWPHAEASITSVQDFTLPTVQGFPNPASKGALVTLSTDNLNVSSGAVRFFDLKGRVVHNVSFDSVISHQVQVTIPESIGTGLFMYQVLDEKNIPLGLGKLQVF